MERDVFDGLASVLLLNNHTIICIYSLAVCDILLPYIFSERFKKFTVVKGLQAYISLLTLEMR